MSKSKKKKHPRSTTLQAVNLPETRAYHKVMNELFRKYASRDPFGNITWSQASDRDLARLADGLDVTLSVGETANSLGAKIGQKITDILAPKYWAAFQKITGSPSYQDLRNMNFIDIHSWADTKQSEKPSDKPTVERFLKCPLLNEQLDDYIQNNFPLDAVPCFENGILRSTAHDFFWFKLESLDPNTGEMIMVLAEYLDDPGQNEYGIVFSCRAKITPIDQDPYFEITLLDFSSGNTLRHKTVPIKALGWGKDDLLIWRNCEVTPVEKDLAQKWVLVTAINFARVNCLLQHHRAKAVPDPDSLETELDPNTEIDLDNPPVRTTELIPGQKPKAKIWTIAGIKIKSATKPQKPKKSTIIRYKAAAWSVSGHLRHYKSGKVVYIKPYQCHRKGLDQTAQPGQRGFMFETLQNPEESEGDE